MGEKEPQATRSRGVLDGSSIFFLRRLSGNRYSSMVLASPVIAWRKVVRCGQYPMEGFQAQSLSRRTGGRVMVE